MTCGFLHRFSREKVLPLWGQFFNFMRIKARDHVELCQKRYLKSSQNGEGDPNPSKNVIFEKIVEKLNTNFQSVFLPDLPIRS